jgi:hypothetical protein
MPDGSESEKGSSIRFPSEMRLSRTWDDAFERFLWSSAIGLGAYRFSRVWCEEKKLCCLLVMINPSHEIAPFSLLQLIIR